MPPQPKVKKRAAGRPIPIHPREPLTKKARAAIRKYADHKAETKFQGYRMAGLMVDWVLEAERMPRERLYTYLETLGYRWLAQHGFWEKRNNGKKGELTRA